MQKEYWDEKLAKALDLLSEARKGFKDWLLHEFPGLVMHRPFDNTNCASGTLGVLCDVDGNDVVARFVWNGVFIEIIWGVCATSSYFHVKFYEGKPFESVVDEFECDNPADLPERIRKAVEKLRTSQPAKQFLVRQKNEKGEYEDIGILTLREACRIEFETKRAVCLTPVSGRFGKLGFDEAVNLDRLDN